MHNREAQKPKDKLYPWIREQSPVFWLLFLILQIPEVWTQLTYLHAKHKTSLSLTFWIPRLLTVCLLKIVLLPFLNLHWQCGFWFLFINLALSHLSTKIWTWTYDWPRLTAFYDSDVHPNSPLKLDSLSSLLPLNSWDTNSQKGEYFVLVHEEKSITIIEWMCLLPIEAPQYKANHPKENL